MGAPSQRRPAHFGRWQPPKKKVYNGKWYKLEPGEDVNLYTGDFSYTVPLFSMGGYPFNLSYSSNVTMEQEASWVGLGWNLDIGAIDRQVRGLPDDFRGDKVVQEDNIRPDITATFGVGLALELVGKEQ
jgi:hypothetical protein